jgi:hypothetical protein
LSTDSKGDLFVVVTRHLSDTGREVTNVYGTWTQRKTAMKHKTRFQAIPGVQATTTKMVQAKPTSLWG